MNGALQWRQRHRFLTRNIGSIKSSTATISKTVGGFHRRVATRHTGAPELQLSHRTVGKPADTVPRPTKNRRSPAWRTPHGTLRFPCWTGTAQNAGWRIGAASSTAPPLTLVLPRSIQRGSPQLGRQFGHQVEQITHQTIVGHTEDRCFLVLVDGHDDHAVLHAGQVLNRP